MMQNAAQGSFSRSMAQNAIRSKATMAMLNCCMNRAASSSWAQNHPTNTRWPVLSVECFTAKNSSHASATSHRSIPNHTGSHAKGATTNENTGP